MNYYKSFDQHTDAQMESALAKADSTFQNVWSKASFRDRAKVVGKAASLLLERKEQLARLAAIEMGKRISGGRDEMEMSAAILKYFADHAEAFLAPQPIDTPMGDAHLEFSPLGVLVGVQPWNFLYYHLARFVAPNLMAGNVLLVKHSSGVPQCALAFQQLLTDGGAPCGAYTNLFVSSDQVGRLLDDPRTKRVGCVATLQGGWPGDVKESRDGNPTRDLQMAADRTRDHTLCGPVVSSLFSLAAQC